MKTKTSVMNDNQADVGIGTLIVFIAMVLVAAVAAAVLIQTSGVLQQKAQQTGKEVTAEVSSNLKVTSVVGQTDGNKTYVQFINITVELSAGGSPIDFSKVVIKYINETTSTTLNMNTADTGPTAALFNYSEERVGVGSPNHVLQAADLAVITLDLSQTNQQLYPRRRGTLNIIPETGVMVLKDVLAPATFGDNTIVQLFP